MILWVLNQELERINGIEQFSSFILTKRYSVPSEFELHLPMTEENLQLIQDGQLSLGNILMKESELVGYLIEEMNSNFEKNGGEIVIKGRDLRVYLDRRIILGEKAYFGTPQKLIHDWLESCVINPKDNQRKMKQFKLGDFPNSTRTMSVELKYTNLLESISTLCQELEWGFSVEIELSTKQLVLTIYEGVDRTNGQSKNTKVLFSQDFENILTQSVIVNNLNLKTTALVESQWEEQKYLLEVANSTSDILRREIYVDAKNIGQPTGEDKLTETQQKELVKQVGTKELLDFQIIQTVEADVVMNGSTRYQEDFMLGDRVTILSESLGLELDTRIETVEEVYEERGLEIRLSFGNQVPTLVDKIRKKVK